MRLLLLMLCALSCPTLGQADEVVVFTDGNRMTVKGYEVKDTVVVITTLEGKLRSLPRSYVDLDATTGATSRTPATAAPSSSAAPSSGDLPTIPKERISKVRWALEHYGGKPLLEAFFKGVDEGVLGEDAAISNEMAAELRNALKSSFEPDRLFSEAMTSFLRRANPAAVDAWVIWLDSPVTRKVLALERWEDTLGPGNAAPAPTPSPSKVALVARLEKTTQISGTWYDMYTNAITRMIASVRSGAPELANSATSTMAPGAPDFGGRAPFQEGLAKYLAFAYGPLSDAELERYLSFWESPQGRAVSKAMRNALLEAFGSAGASSGKAVVEIYRRYLPNLNAGGAGSKPAATPAPATEPAPVAEPPSYDELGFRFATPPADWVFFDVKRFNAAAVLGYMRSKPQVLFMIVVEEIPPESMSSAAAATLVRANLESREKSFHVVSEEPMSLHGLDGVLLVSDARILTHAAHYLHWVYANRDRVYQLIAWALSSNADLETLRKEALSIESGFTVIDREPEPTPSVPTQHLADHRSERYGYGVHLTGSNWASWENLADDLPAADFGGLQENSGFVVVPVHLGKLDPSNENLAKGLLQRLQIEWSAIASGAVHPIDDAGRRGYLIDFERDVNQRHYVYRMNVWRGREFGYLVAAWTRADDKSVLDDLLSRFEFDPDCAWPKDRVLDESEKAWQAMTLNDVGIEYYRQGQYGTSADFFEAAVDAKPSDAAMLRNLMSALTHTSRFEEALRKLDERMPAFPDDLQLLSYRPYLLQKLGKREQAVELYRGLFAKGYQNDDDLIDYGELLWELERKDEAIEAVKSYRRNRDSLTVARFEAALYRRLGKHQAAIALLQQTHQAFPTDREVTLDLVESYYAAEKYDQSRDLARNLISKGEATAEAHFLEGRAELALGAYPEAKAAFQAALDLDPTYRDARDYLTHVSGLMGQGDQEPVRRPIDPVEIPPALATSPAAPDDDSLSELGAYYANRVTAISFIPGEDYRRTERYLVRIVDRKALSTFSSFQFDLDPTSERLYVNELRVLDDKGNLVAEGDPSSYYVTDDRSADMATEDKVLNVPVPGLAPGHSIELTYTRERLSPPEKMPYVSYTFSSGFPILRASLYLSGSIDRVRYRGEHVAPETVLPNAVYWVQSSPPVYRSEDYADSLERYLPFVWIGDSGASWETIGRNYLKDIRERLVIDDETKELAHSLVRGLSTGEEQVAAIADYVQKSYTYKAIEFGRRAWLPNPTAQIIRNKYGDCKDHALLFYSLLRALDLPAQLVLVSAGSELQKEVPSLDQFDHMIVYSGDTRGGRFFDLTDKNYDVSRLPPMGLGGKTALVLDPARPHLVQLPEYPDDSSRVRSARKVEAEGSDLVVDEVLTLDGYYGAWLRSVLREDDTSGRREQMQRYLDSGGHARLEDLEAENLGEPRKALILHLRYRIDGALHEADRKLVGKLPAIWERTFLSVVSADERRNPFRIAYPLVFEGETRVAAPPGYRIASTPTHADDAEGAVAQWSVETRVSADALLLRSETRRPARRGSAREFREVVATMSDFLDAAQASLVLAKQQGS